MKIAILGGGTTAAYVYAACSRFEEETGEVNIEVITSAVIEPTSGAFWLREIPDDLKSDFRDELIHLFCMGDKENYLRRQWGKSFNLDVFSSSSFDKYDYSPTVFGYNPAKIIPELWKGADIRFTGRDMLDGDIMHLARSYDVVFCTFPTQRSSKYMRESGALVKIPVLLLQAEYNHEKRKNIVLYNGTPLGAMVRVSQLFGSFAMEYSYDHIVNMDAYPDKVRLRRLLDIKPDAPKWDPDETPANNVFLLGRYAEWNRTRLSHEVYDLTQNILREIV